jgi:hypothetical protein
MKKKRERRISQRMAQTSTQISGNLIPQGKKIEPKKVKLH